MRSPRRESHWCFSNSRGADQHYDQNILLIFLPYFSALVSLGSLTRIAGKVSEHVLKTHEGALAQMTSTSLIHLHIMLGISVGGVRDVLCGEVIM